MGSRGAWGAAAPPGELLIAYAPSLLSRIHRAHMKREKGCGDTREERSGLTLCRPFGLV